MAQRAKFRRDQRSFVAKSRQRLRRRLHSAPAVKPLASRVRHPWLTRRPQKSVWIVHTVALSNRNTRQRKARCAASAARTLSLRLRRSSYGFDPGANRRSKALRIIRSAKRSKASGTNTTARRSNVSIAERPKKSARRHRQRFVRSAASISICVITRLRPASAVRFARMVMSISPRKVISPAAVSLVELL